MNKITITLLVTALLCLNSEVLKGQGILSDLGDSNSPLSIFQRFNFLQNNTLNYKKSTNYRLIGFKTTNDASIIDSGWIKMPIGQGTDPIITPTNQTNNPDNAYKNLYYDSVVLWMSDNANPPALKIRLASGYEFNSSGKVNQLMVESPSTQVKYIYVYSYNNQDSLVLMENYKWESFSGTWKPNSRIQYQYSVNKRETIIMSFTGAWDSVHVIDDYFSSNGQLDSSYKKSKANSNGSKVWISNEAHAYQYNSAGLLIEDKTYDYNYTIPGMYLWMTETMTYNANNDLIEYKRYRNQHYEFIDYYYYSGKTLDSFYRETFSGIGTSMTPNTKISYTYNNGNIQGEHWQFFFQNNWYDQLLIQYKTDINGNLDSSISHSFSVNGWLKTIKTKFYFEEYFTNNAVLIEANQNALIVYPNPGRNELNFKIESSETNKALVILYALDGSQVFQESCQFDKEFKIKPQLDKGIYFYKVRVKNSIYSGKILLE